METNSYFIDKGDMTVGDHDAFSDGYARPVDHSLLSITGYTDRFSYLPGESVSVHASSTHRTGSLSLVRLGHDGQLLTQGYTNAQLARRLHRSKKTVDKHVAAVLDKLGVHSRTQAIAAAFSLGIVQAKIPE